MNTLFLMQLSYFFTTITFIMQRTHLLMSLLSLEGMMLSLVLMIPSFLHASSMFNSTTYAIILLTLGACEASLGLSLMVVMSRNSGSDLMMSMTMSKC